MISELETIFVTLYQKKEKNGEMIFTLRYYYV